MRLRGRLVEVAAGDRRRPWRTVRLRLTALYVALFVLSAAALLTFTYLLVDASSGDGFVATKDGVTIAGFQYSVGGGSPKGKGGVAQSTMLSQGSPRTTAEGGGHIVGGHIVGGHIVDGRVVGGHIVGGHIVGLAKVPNAKQMQDQAHQFLQLAFAAQRNELHDLLMVSILGLAIMSVLSIGLGWVIAGRVLRPLRTITATAREISASNLHRRLGLEGPDDELKELGDTIDGLLERLDAAFQSQRQFVANASHELRTPLARQRTLAQVALADPEADAESLRSAHERILASGEQQEQLIDALLTLSRVQAGMVRRQSMDLSSVLREQLDGRRFEAMAREIELTAVLQPAVVQGDPRLVERLASNLVDNAIRHNEVGGSMAVQTGTVDGRGFLEVSNDGALIHPDEVERLYVPFERLDSERLAGTEGFGLGLCIVGAVASAHGAGLITEARREGGLRIVVEFPAPAASGRLGASDRRAERGAEPEPPTAACAETVGSTEAVVAPR